MTVQFPPHVDEFCEIVRELLNHFDLKLSLEEEVPASEAKIFAVSGSDYLTKLIVHRTQRSIDQEVGEYRARMWTELPEPIAVRLGEVDEFQNKLSTLGTLIGNEKGADVGAQCLIDPNNLNVLGGVMAASIAQAATSLLGSISASLKEDPPEEEVHSLSAWGDLDFEQIQYDYAHLGLGSRRRREWSLKLNLRHEFTLTSVENNPYFGGGLLGLLWVSDTEFSSNDNVLSVRQLNNLEQLFGDAPTFGGWCKDNENYVFCSFYPNYLKGLIGFTDSVIRWALVRSHAIPRLVAINEMSELEEGG